ncbi:MAG: PilZ domain-containing protein, partial [Nitrospirota bacterium]|nr:PilZ domain-containing protein [Nitrospirota bacterium]
MDNKRRQKRFARQCEMEFISNNIIFRGLSSDFSLVGLYIVTDHPCFPDTTLDITIHLPDGLDSKIRGTVRRTLTSASGNMREETMSAQKIGMGIEIIEKDTNYLHLIRSLLSDAGDKRAALNI